MFDRKARINTAAVTDADAATVLCNNSTVEASSGGGGGGMKKRRPARKEKFVFFKKRSSVGAPAMRGHPQSDDKHESTSPKNPCSTTKCWEFVVQRPEKYAATAGAASEQKSGGREGANGGEGRSRRGVPHGSAAKNSNFSKSEAAWAPQRCVGTDSWRTTAKTRRPKIHTEQPKVEEPTQYNGQRTRRHRTAGPSAGMNLWTGGGNGGGWGDQTRKCLGARGEKVQSFDRSRCVGTPRWASAVENRSD